jgi:hypothetical protein
MAPTKAKARYAVHTLSRLTKVMGTLPWFTSLPALTFLFTNRFPPQKVSAAVPLPAFHRPDVVKES